MSGGSNINVTRKGQGEQEAFVAHSFIVAEGYTGMGTTVLIITCCYLLYKCTNHNLQTWGSERIHFKN